MIKTETYPTYIYMYSDEDLVLTKYQECEDILTYAGSKKVYESVGADLSVYREITEEQHFAYEEERYKKENPSHEDVQIGVTGATFAN